MVETQARHRCRGATGSWIPRLLVAAALALGANRIPAHTPHDAIADVTVSPEFETDRTVLAIVRRSNLLRSTDGGVEWHRSFAGMDNSAALTAVTFAPDRPGLVYVSTDGDGVYMSQDAGVTWADSSTGLDTGRIGRLTACPGGRVYAAPETTGLYRLVPSTTRWHRVGLPHGAGEVTAVSCSGAQSGLYAGLGDGSILRSSDDGRTWERWHRIPGEAAITGIDMIPAGSGQLDLLVSTRDGALLRSPSEAPDFRPVTSRVADEVITAIAALREAGGTRLLATLWHSGVHCVEVDAAKTNECSTGLTKDAQADEFDVPHFLDLAVTATGTVFLAGFDGLFRSEDGGETWSQLVTLPPSLIVAFRVSPTFAVDRSIGVITYETGLYASSDAGRSWRRTLTRTVAGGSWKNRLRELVLPRQRGTPRLLDIAISPEFASDRTLYASKIGDLYESTDAGESWERIRVRRPDWPKKPRFDVLQFVPNAESVPRLFAGGRSRGGIFSLADGETDYREIGKDIRQWVHALAISPGFSRDGTLFASLSEGRHPDYRRRIEAACETLVPRARWPRSGRSTCPLLGVFRSRDGGRSWQRADRGLPAREVGVELAISPEFISDRVVLAGTARGVFLSRDAGETWTEAAGGDLLAGATITDVAISPAFPRDHTLLVNAKGDGLYLSDDRGGTFRRLPRTVAGRPIAFSELYEFLPNGSPAVQFSPDYARDATIYATDGYSVFQGTDTGREWERLAGPFALHSESDDFDSSVRRLVPLVTGLLLAAAIAWILLHRRRTD